MSKLNKKVINTVVGNTEFERLLVATVRDFRERAKQCDMNNLSIRIEASGRIDGDLHIVFEMGEPYSDYGYVKGNTIENVFDEMLRRRGWNQRHKPLCLPNVEGNEVIGDDYE